MRPENIVGIAGDFIGELGVSHPAHCSSIYGAPLGRCYTFQIELMNGPLNPVLDMILSPQSRI